jgi:hypothetical protein
VLLQLLEAVASSCRCSTTADLLHGTFLVCSDEEETSNGVAPDATVDLPPEKRGPAAASSSQDERDAYSSSEDVVLQSAEDIRELRSR